jgi:hypothetical protein
MSNWRPSNVKFWITAGVTVTAAAGLVASAWPLTHHYLTDQATALERAGELTDGNEAALNFRLAAILDPGSGVNAWHYASVRLESGDATGALSVLNRARVQSESSSAKTVRMQALLETGQNAQAGEVAHNLLSSHPNEDQITQAALVLAAVGKGSDVAALEARVSSPEAAGRRHWATAGNLAVADALAASGLLRSSRALLLHTPESAPREIRLASLESISKTKSDWVSAARHYEIYLAAMPADAKTRLAYANLLDKLKRPNDADLQRQLASDLQNGRP